MIWCGALEDTKMNEDLKYAPYSHSKMSLWHECPRKFKFNYIDKLRVYKDKPYFEKGKFFHYALEYFPKPPPKPFNFRFPENKLKSDEFVEQIRALVSPGTEVSDLLMKYRLRSEFTFYLSPEFQAVSKKAGSLLTGVIDYVGQKRPGQLTIVDWKTGTSKVKDESQVKLYAVWGFAACPNIDVIECEFQYLESGTKWDMVFERSQFDDLAQECINKIDPIEQDEEFSIKRNDKCQWCDYFDHCKPHQIQVKR